MTCNVGMHNQYKQIAELRLDLLLFHQTLLIKPQSSHWYFVDISQIAQIHCLRFCWYINKSVNEHFAFFGDISTTETQPFCVLLIYQQKCIYIYIYIYICMFCFCLHVIKKKQNGFVFYIQSKAQTAHWHFCWYISKSAKMYLHYWWHINKILMATLRFIKHVW